MKFIELLNNRHPHVRIIRTFNYPDLKKFEVLLAPRIGKITLFEGENYDNIEEFTEDIIEQKIKELYDNK